MEIELFANLDKEKTKNDVNELLSQYRRLLRVAGTRYEPKVTTTYSLEMNSQTNLIRIPQDTALIMQDEALQTLIDIHSAFNTLNPEERKLIYDKYLRKNRLSDYMIYPKYGWSEATFYRNLKETLVKFAEAFRHGKLLVFSKMSDN
ncbi:ArpU family phage packaging/lysis transcriptional regulator [Liquorilactobacillus capillatus]|uniref:Phage transcriptional regulator, ArpU family n=1 Tax=Liquorilactobacillus capillatus DSM 19910 TaxID=1423731 RepID=A0A0R1M399_9LACO|nr:ArpU family phage packaging/lysis transcriptional regulator [Liquorilactobacillus capillatus]KRL02511.1 hypothetical protein FC81_GL000676 [Liquorilactobacillus capillatus DSM 19910]